MFTNGFCAANLENRIVSFSQRISKAIETTEPSKLPELLERIEALRKRVAERTSLLQAYLEHPIVPLFSQFTTETAGPTAVSSPPHGSVVLRVPSMAWTDSHRIGEGILMRTNLAGTGECLVVRSQALHNNSGGSWRARVRLPAGDYLFEGEVTRLYSSQIAESVAPAILFQLMDGRRTPLPWPRKDGEGARLRIHFKVVAPEEVVELCCGLDGMRSGVVFPVDLIRLTRL